MCVSIPCAGHLILPALKPIIYYCYEMDHPRREALRVCRLHFIVTESLKRAAKGYYKVCCYRVFFFILVLEFFRFLLVFSSIVLRFLSLLCGLLLLVFLFLCLSSIVVLFFSLLCGLFLFSFYFFSFPSSFFAFL